MRFAVIGLDHRHIYELTAGLIEAGGICAGFSPETTDPRVLAGFRKRFPSVRETSRQRLLDDATIAAVVTAAIPRDRAALAIEAMRRGKDVMSDKPGLIALPNLTALERVVAETGRIFSICFSERLLSPATETALRLVRSGAIGQVIQTVGLGPHRLNRPLTAGLVLGSRASGRDPGRYRLSSDRSVHRLHRHAASRDRACQRRALCLAQRVRRFR